MKGLNNARLMFLILIVPLLTFGAKEVDGQILPVPRCKQMGKNTCWAATCEGMLAYYGIDIAECEILDWARAHPSDCCNNFDRHCDKGANDLCCTEQFPGYPTCVNNALDTFGGPTITGSYCWDDPVSPSDIFSQMRDGRPFVILFDVVDDDHYHACTGHGYVGDSTDGEVHWINPNRPQEVYWHWYNVALDFTDEHHHYCWENSLTFTSPLKPHVNISANGSEIPITLTGGGHLDVMVETDDNNYGGYAEWWVAVYLEEADAWYYLDRYGAWRPFSEGIKPWRRGPLTDLSSTVVSMDIPYGYTDTWEFYFGLDLDYNYCVDDLFYDYIKVEFR